MELERDAALFACKQYASMSQDVTKTVVPKLEELLSSLSSTETLKIKILDALQSMNYDLETSCQVKELCLKLLDDQVYLATWETQTFLWIYFTRFAY